MSAGPVRADFAYVDELPEAIEYAILREALSGASRVELWLAVRLVSPFASVDRVAKTIDALAAKGELVESRKHWTTTSAGRARLDRDAAAC
jgi:hypothetical protein